MGTVNEVVALRPDEAVEIGNLVRKGMEFWIEAGERLTRVKISLPHGKFIDWIEKNYNALGFGERTAQRLMELAAKPQLTADLWWNASRGRPPAGGGCAEWYTPKEYIDLARTVMGDIDFDPATSQLAQEIVQAKDYCTIGGIEAEWHGCVWLNPPYSYPEIEQFAEKVVLSLPFIDSAIVLTNNATDTAWFQKLANHCDAICFTRGRINFHTPEGSAGMPMQGQSFFYFGDNIKSFVETFASVGLMMVRVAV